MDGFPGPKPNNFDYFEWELLVLGGVSLVSYPVERMKKHFGSLAFWGVKKMSLVMRIVPAIKIQIKFRFQEP